MIFFSGIEILPAEINSIQIWGDCKWPENQEIDFNRKQGKEFMEE